MTNVIVDASVILACAISDGKARRTLLAASNIEFYSPEFVLEEVRRSLPKVIALSGVSPAILSTLLDDVFSRVAVVPRVAFADALPEARSLTARADAAGDEDYVALALKLRAPVWTYDKDFHRIPKIRVIGRRQIELDSV